jgi:hypothetical protein
MKMNEYLALKEQYQKDLDEVLAKKPKLSIR